MNKEEILNKVVAYSRTKASEGHEYAYAFGMMSVLLTDKQLELLEKLAQDQGVSV